MLANGIFRAYMEIYLRDRGEHNPDLHVTRRGNFRESFGTKVGAYTDGVKTINRAACE